MKKIILIGPSGTGKSTVADKLCDLYGFTQLQSFTTRPKRYDDEQGHTFVDKFERTNDILAETFFNGHYYWSTLQQVKDSEVIIFDKAGIECLGDYRDECFVIGLKCSEDELKKRIPDRLERIAHDKEKFKNYEDVCDCVIDANKPVDEVMQSIIEILDMNVL